MVRVLKRSNGVLYIQYNIGDRIIRRSTRLQDTKENRALIKKEVIPAIQRKIIMGEVSGVKPKEFNHYAKIFQSDKQHLKTYSQIASVIEVLNKSFGDIQIDKITRGDVKDFVRDRLKINSPKTINNYLTPLRGIFDIAIDHEVIKDNPCANIQLPKHTKKKVEPFSSEEVDTILGSCSGSMQLFLAICFYTGIRTGEALALMPSDIDMDRRVIMIRRSINKGKVTTPKTETSIREVPILKGLVKYLPKSFKSIWVFNKLDGKPYASFSGAKQKEWRELLEKNDIAYRKIYATRHTFIVSMLKNSNLSILEIAQMVGHSSTQMIIQNYGQFIKGEHLKVDREIELFSDKKSDSILRGTL